MTRSVDEVDDVLVVAHLPREPDVLRLDRDAPLTLDVHAVEVLGTHLPLLDHTGELEHAVGQRRLAVIDVRDDAEIPDPGRIRERLVGEAADGGPLTWTGTGPVPGHCHLSGYPSHRVAAAAAYTH